MTASTLRARCARHVYGSYPLARLFAGLAFLGVTLSTRSVPHALALFVAILIMLVAMGVPGRSMLRAIKVLAFLMLPIMALHMWLTPGRMWVAGISIEGLERGGWLSLHLVLMYFSAMLFSRLLSVPEWMALTSLCGGRRLQPYLMLLMPLARQVRWRTGRLARRWRQRGTWRELALTLAAVLGQCLEASRRQADALWLRWPACVHPSGFLSAPAPSNAGTWVSTLILVLVGAAVLVGGR